MSINKKISETAVAVASLRALSNYENDDKFKCNDDYAELFLPDEKRIPLKDSKVRDSIKKAIPKGMFEYVISRTKYFDSVFIEAVKQNIGQIVFLGAGFDSRPYRFNELLDNTKIFEVDTEATQKYKKALLTNSFKNIEYVSNNFEDDNLFDKLRKHGYKHTDKTLFLWEGVTFYLTKETVFKMLKDIRKNSASRSMICFDFQTIKSIEELIKTGLKEESIKFGVEEGKINEFVSLNGYKIIEHLNSKAIEQRFMKKETGDLFGEIAPIMNFILIEHN
jgi:methyltransferase, putative, TIGR00027 family